MLPVAGLWCWSVGIITLRHSYIIRTKVVRERYTSSTDGQVIATRLTEYYMMTYSGEPKFAGRVILMWCKTSVIILYVNMGRVVGDRTKSQW